MGDPIFVLIKQPSATWQQIYGWSSGSICASQFTPPADRVPPNSLFRGVWCDNVPIRDAIGWGIETGRYRADSGVQEFENGYILRKEDQTVAYVLFKDSARFVIEQAP